MDLASARLEHEGRRRIRPKKLAESETLGRLATKPAQPLLDGGIMFIGRALAPQALDREQGEVGGPEHAVRLLLSTRASGSTAALSKSPRSTIIGFIDFDRDGYDKVGRRFTDGS